MKALLDLFKQVTQEQEFDAIKTGLASPEKIAGDFLRLASELNSAPPIVRSA